MKIIHLKNSKKQNVSTPLFTGKVTRQSPVAHIEEADISINYVHFPRGIRNKFHSHSNGQVLIVTKGHGIVASKKNAVKVKTGDLIWIPAGEIHRHGATPHSDFTHISVTPAHTNIHQIEK